MLTSHQHGDPHDLSQAAIGHVGENPRLAKLPHDPEGPAHEVRRFRTEHGHFRIHREIESRELGERRDLIIYLPPEYKDDRSARFPVMYMHDGQNVLSPVKGTAAHSWNVDITLASLFKGRQADPFIVVALPHSPDNRAFNYTPDREAQLNAGGGFKDYFAFLTREVKSLIDDLYRTRPERSSTWTAGASLGAIAALSCAMQSDTPFSRCIALDPPLHWADQAMLRRAEAFSPPHDTKVFMDITERAPGVSMDAFERIAPILTARGLRPNDNFFHLKYAPDDPREEAGHNEFSWGIRFRPAVRLIAA